MPHTGETPGKASTNAKIAGNKLRWMKIRTGSLHARTATKRSIRKREKNVILLDGVFLYSYISEIGNLHLYAQSVHVRFPSFLSPSAYVIIMPPSHFKAISPYSFSSFSFISRIFFSEKPVAFLVKSSGIPSLMRFRVISIFPSCLPPSIKFNYLSFTRIFSKFHRYLIYT